MDIYVANWIEFGQDTFTCAVETTLEACQQAVQSELIDYYEDGETDTSEMDLNLTWEEFPADAGPWWSANLYETLRFEITKWEVQSGTH